jgi:hypothetical protein
MTDQTNALLHDIILQVSNMNKSIGSLEAAVENLSRDAGKQGVQGNAERHDMQITITDIRGKIGIIEGSLAVSNERHRDFARSLDNIYLRTGTIETEVANITPFATTVSEMKPQVKELMDFKGRMAGIIVGASFIIGSATWFAWEGIKWFVPNAKNIIAGMFH